MKNEKSREELIEELKCMVNEMKDPLAESAKISLNGIVKELIPACKKTKKDLTASEEDIDFIFKYAYTAGQVVAEKIRSGESVDADYINERMEFFSKMLIL